MKKLAFASILALFTIVAVAKEKNSKPVEAELATVEISGSVADNLSGESLVGVEVKLEGTDLKTYTDFDGKFSFNVKPGEYKVVANYISYQKKTEVLNLSENKNELKINLQTSN